MSELSELRKRVEDLEDECKSLRRKLPHKYTEAELDRKGRGGWGC